MTNNIYVLIGPSGSGKTTIASELVELGLHPLVSHTIRQMRPGESEGKDYYYVTEEIFSQTKLVEGVCYAGNLYGLSKKEVERALRRTTPSVVVMDINGGLEMRKICGDRVKLVAILASEQEIAARMKQRGDNEESINKRLENANSTREFDNWRLCDYAIKNNSIRSSVNQVLSIVDLDCALQSRTA